MAIPWYIYPQLDHRYQPPQSAQSRLLCVVDSLTRSLTHLSFAAIFANSSSALRRESSLRDVITHIISTANTLMLTMSSPVAYSSISCAAMYARSARPTPKASRYVLAAVVIELYARRRKYLQWGI